MPRDLLEFKLPKNHIRVEVFSLLIHENLAIPCRDIERDREYDYITFKDFKPIYPEELTDDDRYEIMCQFHNLFAFLELHGYQLTGIDIRDVGIRKKNNHILVHNLEVKKPNSKFFTPNNNYLLPICAEMLGNPKVLGCLQPCRLMKQAFTIKQPQYVEPVRKFNC